MLKLKVVLLIFVSEKIVLAGAKVKISLHPFLVSDSWFELTNANSNSMIHILMY